MQLQPFVVTWQTFRPQLYKMQMSDFSFQTLFSGCALGPFFLRWWSFGQKDNWKLTILTMRKGNLASTSPCHPRLSKGRDIVIKITSLLLIVFGKLAFLACVCVVTHVQIHVCTTLIKQPLSAMKSHFPSPVSLSVASNSHSSGLRLSFWFSRNVFQWNHIECNLLRLTSKQLFNEDIIRSFPSFLSPSQIRGLFSLCYHYIICA